MAVRCASDSGAGARPAGVGRRPETATVFGQGTTEIETGASTGTGKRAAPRFSGRLSPFATVPDTETLATDWSERTR